MNCKEIRNIITKFIHDEVGKTGSENVVIGISGGLDSAVVLNLAIHALGVDRVIAILMPENLEAMTSCNYKDSLKLTELYKVRALNTPVNWYLKPKRPLYYSGEREKLRYGNMIARIRMAILYNQAMLRDAIVLGTTNKTELMLGYFTKYGDSGVDIEPIADIYKTEVFKLAKYIGVPDYIINKVPSADLWDGQTDEEELGLKYEEVDQVLWWLIEEDWDAVALSYELEKLTGIKDKTIIDKTLTLISKNYHKRHMPKVCQIGNIDIRTTMANGWRNKDD